MWALHYKRNWSSSKGETELFYVELSNEDGSLRQRRYITEQVYQLISLFGINHSCWVLFGENGCKRSNYYKLLNILDEYTIR